MPDKNTQLSTILDLLSAYEGKYQKPRAEIDFLNDQLNCYATSVENVSALFRSWADLLLYLDYFNYQHLDQEQQGKIYENVLAFIKSNKRLEHVLTKHTTIEKVHEKLIELIQADFEAVEIAQDCRGFVKFSNVIQELHDSKMVTPTQSERLLLSLHCYEALADEESKSYLDIVGMIEFVSAIIDPQKWKAFWNATLENTQEYDIFQNLIENLDYIVSQNSTTIGHIFNAKRLWAEISALIVTIVQQAATADASSSCRQQLIEFAEAKENVITPTP